MHDTLGQPQERPPAETAQTGHGGPRLRWARLDPWLRRSLLVALGSRAAVLVVGFVAAHLWRAQDVDPVLHFPARAEVYHGWLGTLINPWAHFDGVWFIHIANEGYRLDNGTTAFFPLYPAALWLASWLTGREFEIAGILLSIVFFVVAAALLHRLVALDLSPRVAFWSVVLLSVFPASFFFQAVYSESLFLLASVACFWFTRKRAWALAGVCGLLASATRLAGVVLLVPMALTYWHDRRRGEVSDRTLFSFLLVPAGVGLYALYLWLALGDIHLFGSAEQRWGREPTFPLFTIWRGAVKAFHGAEYLLTGHGIPADPAYVGYTLAFIRRETAIVNLLSFAILVLACWALWVGRRRIPLGYTLYALGTITLPLLAPRPQVPLMSMPRFALVAFPLFVALAAWGESRPRARWVLVAIFATVLVFCTARFVLWLFVA